MASIDLDVFNSYVERRLISRQEHPSACLSIWNYTPECQFGRAWDDVTMQARGLITLPCGDIVARPFRKFFNLEEHREPLPNESFHVAEKLDGSLGILYWDGSSYSIATRGSFISEQAIKGTAMLQQHLREHGDAWIDPAYTYLFEIIYPKNRIVVDYGAAERLVLLAIIHTETGEERDIQTVNYPDKAKCFASPDKLEALYDAPIDNAEGYVIRFQSGLRVKMKFAEYVRLHRLLTGMSSKTVWEMLRADQSLDELVANVPDEFYQWVQDTADDLREQHAALLFKGYKAYTAVRDLPSRKEMALALASEERTIRAMAFAHLDEDTIKVHEIAWKAVKPGFERPFTQDIDG